MKVYFLKHTITGSEWWLWKWLKNCVLAWCRFWDGKRKASHTELQSVKHGTHTQTHHGWNTHTHIHTMTNMLLVEARISCWLKYRYAQTWAMQPQRGEWAGAECHPKSHSMLGNLDRHSICVRNSTNLQKRALGQIKVSASISVANTGCEPVSAGYLHMSCKVNINKPGSKTYLKYKEILKIAATLSVHF